MTKFSSNNKRNMKFIFLVLFFGVIIGSVVTNFIGFMLPKGVVQDFFLMHTTIGWQPFTINFQVIKFTTGFSFDISVASLIGLFLSWYFLRYFK